MNGVLRIKRTRWVPVVWLALMDALFLFAFIKSPSHPIGISFFIVFLTFVLVVVISDHGEVIFDSKGEGVVVYKRRTLLGRWEYTHWGLAKAETIIVIDMGSQYFDYTFYLLFTDGCKIPLPYTTSTLSHSNSDEEKIIQWFQKYYAINLNTKQLTGSEKLSFLRDVKKRNTAIKKYAQNRCASCPADKPA